MDAKSSRSRSNSAIGRAEGSGGQKKGEDLGEGNILDLEPITEPKIDVNALKHEILVDGMQVSYVTVAKFDG